MFRSSPVIEKDDTSLVVSKYLLSFNTRSIMALKSRNRLHIAVAVSFAALKKGESRNKMEREREIYSLIARRTHPTAGYTLIQVESKDK